MEKEYAVIFKTKRQLPMPDAYIEMSHHLVERVSKLPGFLKIDSVADTEGRGISVSYWSSLEAIKKWKEEPLHLEAQKKGHSEWYLDYTVEICEILKSYRK